ncbi:MAG: hypothetical protein ACREI7_03030, partial [Myxococcota bacterium]
LLEDKLTEQKSGPPLAAAAQAQEGEAKGGAAAVVTGLDHRDELWARVSGVPITFEDGSTLRIEIEDVAA